ncbi:hypothetical protein R3P38DRAFT_2925514 [Favolaschia claudopus]|uniref:Uncharacterized protein n=1 Tax=Favolaschia claudopus TaxID=2862362 RepID=A0AAW0BXM6_9AGAR
MALCHLLALLLLLLSTSFDLSNSILMQALGKLQEGVSGSSSRIPVKPPAVADDTRWIYILSHQAVKGSGPPADGRESLAKYSWLGGLGKGLYQVSS